MEDNEKRFTLLEMARAELWSAEHLSSDVIYEYKREGKSWNYDARFNLAVMHTAKAVEYSLLALLAHHDPIAGVSYDGTWPLLMKLERVWPYRISEGLKSRIKACAPMFDNLLRSKDYSTQPIAGLKVHRYYDVAHELFRLAEDEAARRIS